jgi:hypothetical protein
MIDGPRVAGITDVENNVSYRTPGPKNMIGMIRIYYRRPSTYAECGRRYHIIHVDMQNDYIRMLISIFSQRFSAIQEWKRGIQPDNRSAP